MAEFDINDLLLKSRPEQEKALFMEMAHICRNRTTELVVGAAINILITALRQVCRTKDQAEQQWDNIFGFGKDVLMKHYDSVTSKVYSNRPFTQVIRPPHFIDPDKF